MCVLQHQQIHLKYFIKRKTKKKILSKRKKINKKGKQAKLLNKI